MHVFFKKKMSDESVRNLDGTFPSFFQLCVAYVCIHNMMHSRKKKNTC